MRREEQQQQKTEETNVKSSDVLYIGLRSYRLTNSVPIGHGKTFKEDANFLTVDAPATNESGYHRPKILGPLKYVHADPPNLAR